MKATQLLQIIFNIKNNKMTRKDENAILDLLMSDNKVITWRCQMVVLRTILVYSLKILRVSIKKLLELPSWLSGNKPNEYT